MPHEHWIETFWTYKMFEDHRQYAEVLSLYYITFWMMFFSMFFFNYFLPFFNVNHSIWYTFIWAQNICSAEQQYQASQRECTFSQFLYRPWASLLEIGCCFLVSSGSTESSLECVSSDGYLVEFLTVSSSLRFWTFKL